MEHDDLDARQAVAPGWYPDPAMPSTQRFWDGAKWTDNVAPLTPRPPAAAAPVSTWKGIRIVAVGILAAVATIWVVYQASQPSDVDCAFQRLEVSTGERSVYQVDDACR